MRLKEETMPLWYHPCIVCLNHAIIHLTICQVLCLQTKIGRHNNHFRNELFLVHHNYHLLHHVSFSVTNYQSTWYYLESSNMLKAAKGITVPNWIPNLCKNNQPPCEGNSRDDLWFNVWSTKLDKSAPIDLTKNVVLKSSWLNMLMLCVLNNCFVF